MRLLLAGLKQTKKLKDRFIITSSILNYAKRGSGSTNCEVARLKRGTNTLIINWII